MVEQANVYCQLREDLKRAILKRELMPGVPLPPENTLAKQYKISRPSVRKALLELEQSDLIIKKPGKGTFVKDPDADSSQKKIRTIGIDITEVAIGHSYYMELMKGMKKAASEKGFRLLLADDENFESLEELTGIDGMIFTRFPAGRFDKIEKIAEMGLPVVALNRFADSGNISYLTVDFTKEAKRGVEYLTFLGHKRIGILGAPDASDVARWRKKGYFEALLGQNIEINKNYILDSDFSSDIYPEIKRFIQENDFTSLFVTSSKYVYPLCAVIYEMGLRLPDELSILCFDDVKDAIPYPGPKISTITMPLMEMGEKAVNHLYQRLTGNPQIVRETMNAELTLRESCGKPGGDK
jgi:DNA-binding LacI/PurR family transcriptional regulator